MRTVLYFEPFLAGCVLIVVSGWVSARWPGMGLVWQVDGIADIILLHVVGEI